MKRKILLVFSFVLIFLLTACQTVLPPKDKIPTTPSNLVVNNNVLSWDLEKDIKYYQVEMNIKNSIKTFQTSTNFDFTSYLDDAIDTINFRVKALCLDTTYTADSAYSSVYTYKVEKSDITYELDILKQSFLGQNTAPDGWSYYNTDGLYKDNSLKMTKSGSSVTSCPFVAKTSFKVEVTLKGNNTSGDAILTIYGLNDQNEVLEKYEISGPIKGEKYTTSAILTNTNITKIKFEYTKKATGNVGLYDIYIYHLETKEILKMEASGTTTSYKINEAFDYKGKLMVTYSDNTTQTYQLSDIKNDLTITDFVNDRFYKGNLTLTYQGYSISLPYNVSYDYPSYSTSVMSSSIKVSKDMVYITVNSIGILIVTSATTDDDSIMQMVDGGNINYLIAYQNTSLNSDIYIDLNITKEETYHITPTCHLTYQNKNIIFEHFGTKILIPTTKVNSDTDYDFIISSDANNIVKAQNIIINNTTTGKDYLAFSNIYQNNSSLYIYDLTYQDEIMLEINQYDYQFLTNACEVSSVDTWDYDYKHVDEVYHYNHEDYYDSIKNLVGDALKEALSVLITTTHTNIVNYDFAKSAYVLTDPDFDYPGNITLFYTGKSTSGIWDNGVTWNREHVWPKSLSGGLYTDVKGSDKNAGTDLHQLRPASSSINSSRGNKPYGPTTDNIYFEPRDEIKGDVARIIFYMNIRYQMDIEALKVAQSIDLLVTWHKNDPVDYYEEYRNEAIWAIQGNYNPFIDNPWLVDLIYS